jgi:hypothetical protein
MFFALDDFPSILLPVIPFQLFFTKVLQIFLVLPSNKNVCDLKGLWLEGFVVAESCNLNIEQRQTTNPL